LDMKDKCELLGKIAASDQVTKEHNYGLSDFRSEIKKRWLAKSNINAMLSLITCIEPRHKLEGLADLVQTETYEEKRGKSTYKREKKFVDVEHLFVSHLLTFRLSLSLTF
jgi:hypothetical protein